jgi:1,4-dihydroxy-2-naphthoyl-CoA hydrolase
MTDNTGFAALVAAGSDPAGLAARLNERSGGFAQLIGLRFTHVSVDAVEAEVPVGEHLLQPYGLVHGGVYASIVESLASAGAALSAMPRGQTTVGLENTTSFLAGTRGGTLRGRRRTQVWSVELHDDDGRLVSSGRVRMACLDGGATIAGESVGVRRGDGSAG